MIFEVGFLTATKTLSDAVKSDTKVAKKVSGVLDNVQDILANPEKYRESITKTIKEISEAKNIKAADKSKAIDTLTDLVEGKEGKRLFDYCLIGRSWFLK